MPEPKVVNMVTDGVLLPPPPGVCQLCAVDHEPEAPHNQQSLYYQYRFYKDYGVWPTWGDAMKHCPEPVRTKWSTELVRLGVDPSELIPSG